MTALVGRQPRERAVTCSRCGRDTWEIDAICPPCATRPTPAITPDGVLRLADNLDEPTERGLLRGLADSFPSAAMIRAVLAAVESDRARTGERAVTLRGLLAAVSVAQSAVLNFDRLDVHDFCCEHGCACESTESPASPDHPGVCEACDMRVHTELDLTVAATVAYLAGLL